LKNALVLDKACTERVSPLNIFLQVNTSGEDSKSGLEPKDTVTVAREIMEQCPHLNVAGLMTIGSREASTLWGELNPDFQCLSAVRDKVEGALGLKGLELSMGMSDDFEGAIRQGSSSVRVGSKIFGSRNYA